MLTSNIMVQARLFGLLVLLVLLFTGLQYIVGQGIPRVEVRLVPQDVTTTVAVEVPVERVVERVVFVPVDRAEGVPSTGAFQPARDTQPSSPASAAIARGPVADPSVVASVDLARSAASELSAVPEAVAAAEPANEPAADAPLIAVDGGPNNSDVAEDTQPILGTLALAAPAAPPAYAPAVAYRRPTYVPPVEAEEAADESAESVAEDADAEAVVADEGSADEDMKVASTALQVHGSSDADAGGAEEVSSETYSDTGFGELQMELVARTPRTEQAEEAHAEEAAAASVEEEGEPSEP